MAKCPVCRGAGYRLRIDDMRFAMAEIVKCESCDGKGVVEPLTEHEYIQTCTTEQLAEWIVRIVDCEFCPVKKPCKKQPCKKQIERWLKQPHTEKE